MIIQYRSENLRIMPVFGAAARDVSRSIIDNRTVDFQISSWSPQKTAGTSWR